MSHRMPMASAMHNDDELLFFQAGRVRRASRQTIMGSIEQRMQAIEQAPNNASLAQRVGSIEEWRANKAGAIADVSTSGMGVEVLGLSVARASAINQVAGKLNAVLAALRQREVIDA